MAKDTRLYARFDIGMDEHPKIMLLSDAAFRALFESTLYSRRQLSDGFLDERIVLRKWGREVAEELSSNDAVKPSWVRVEGGWMIHDFGEHQTTTADIQAKREAGRKGGLAKAKQTPSTRLAPASEVLEQKASTTLAKTETETETEAETSPVVGLSNADASDPDEHPGGNFPDEPPTPEDYAFIDGMLISEELVPPEQVDPKAAYPADFRTFWDAYPRRQGKGAALTAFLRAKKRAKVTAIIAGAESLRDDPNLPADKALIPMPSTWLNQDRWEDDPLPSPQVSSSRHGQPQFMTAAERKLAAGENLIAKYAALEGQQIAIEG